MVLFDNNIAWVIVHGPRHAGIVLSSLLNGFQEAGFRVVYSHANVYDLKKMGSSKAELVLEWLEERLGQPQGPGIEELEPRLGRYGRWVDKIGK